MVLLISMFVSSCELDDNVDPKAATEVPASTLFTNALISLVNQVDDSSVNNNITRLLAQYWQETTYFTESRYNFQDRSIPDNYFRRFYRDVLRDVKEAKDIINANPVPGFEKTTANQLGILAILEAYSMQCLVDAFGNVPFSEALNGIDDPTPVYDDAKTVYNTVLDDLTAKVKAMDDSADGFGSADVLFNGDVSMWKKFGGSLILRMGMRMADENPARTAKAVNDAISIGMFEKGEGAIFHYIGVSPYNNTIHNAYITNNRKDYLPTNTIIDKMVELSDPRISSYFTKYDDPDKGSIYVGAIAGLDGAQSYNNYSHFSDQFFEATFPAILMDYCEIEFFLAEAALRNIKVPGSAEEHYANAVAASIEYWGGSELDAAAYLLAGGQLGSNWKESIGTQKWIALYNRGVESWAEWRRLDFPTLNVPEGLTYDDIPRRMPYPYDEDQLNGENYSAAVSSMGGDNPKIKLFWDMN